MRLHSRTLSVAALASVAFGQVPATMDAPYQVRYASNFNQGDSFINILNDGASGASHLAGSTAALPGTICANVYAFDPREEIVSCCSCPVTPNGVVSLSIRSDILSNTLTAVVPGSLVLKLVATAPLSGLTGPTCVGSAPAVGSVSSPLLPGLVAWGITLHTAAARTVLTETAFSPAVLSPGELDKLAYVCGFIQGTDGTNGQASGFGICKSCRIGGLGAAGAQ